MLHFLVEHDIIILFVQYDMIFINVRIQIVTFFTRGSHKFAAHPKS